MYYALTLAFIIFIMWYEEKIREKTIKKIESNLTRKIEYRGYCGILSYSYNDNKFFCKFVGIEDIFDISGKKYSSFSKATEDNYFETTSETESGALESFYLRIDSCIDTKPTYLDDDDLLYKYAVDHDISIEEAENIRWRELYIRSLKRESQRNANNRIRYELPF